MGTVARAEDPGAGPPPEPAPAPTIAELARRLAEQQALIEAQAALLAEQAARLGELERKLEEAGALALETRDEVRELQDRPLDATTLEAVEARLAQVEQSVQRVPEMAVENLQGDFPGSFRIPGSDMALRIGGWVRTTLVKSFDAIGSDDRFVTSSIPVEGTAEAGKSSRIELSAGASRFNFDLRTPTGVGHMRAFLESDFAAAEDHLRLRHAFGQWQGWIVGQTWSTFSDPQAIPDGIDFEGLNAISLVRQPQVRRTWKWGERRAVAVAIEEANPDLTGAEGVNQVPDLIARLRWEPGERFRGPLLVEGSHVQGALLLRQLRGEVEGVGGRARETLSTRGYGFNLSGVVPSPWERERDRFRFAANFGEGIARYVTDLEEEGGLDAIHDPVRGELEAVPVGAGYLGFEHWWRETVRSTLTLGYVWVDNLDAQADDALHRTERYSLNLVWSPIPRLDLVAEYLWGRRVDRDRRSGQASQLQLGGTFRF